jgi:hypothetical protein
MSESPGTDRPWGDEDLSVEEAMQRAEQAIADARARAEAEGRPPPGWAVDPAGQTGWKELAGLTPEQQRLVQDVVNAKDVLVGASRTIGGNVADPTAYEQYQDELRGLPGELGAGQLTLDKWLVQNNIDWRTQPTGDQSEWQDVYNRALFLRTSIGRPVNVMAGAGWTGGEVPPRRKARDSAAFRTWRLVGPERWRRTPGVSAVVVRADADRPKWPRPATSSGCTRLARWPSVSEDRIERLGYPAIWAQREWACSRAPHRSAARRTW